MKLNCLVKNKIVYWDDCHNCSSRRCPFLYTIFGLNIMSDELPKRFQRKTKLRQELFHWIYFNPIDKILKETGYKGTFRLTFEKMSDKYWRQIKCHYAMKDEERRRYWIILYDELNKLKKITGWKDLSFDRRYGYEDSADNLADNGRCNSWQYFGKRIKEKISRVRNFVLCK